MHCLMLLSSQRWFCALSGSARGRISEFRDAHKVEKHLRGRNNPSTLSLTLAPGEPPSPSPSIIRRRTPAALAVGVHPFQGPDASRRNQSVF
jgi:hypothetical protein